MKKSEKKIAEAMDHPDKLGAGAKKRKKLNAAENVSAVMKEFDRGTLHSGSGEIVKNKEQAVAIALSEAKKKRKKK